jgi:quercetin dioxygenase-like cupin family protein
MPDSSELKVFSTNTSAVPWVERHNPKLGMSNFIKILHQDDETGMRVSLNFYPKGYVTKWHTHPCGHGMYVLEGILRTHEGVYGPGSFVWFPEGIVAEHGATAETDVSVVFITNKLFDITYVE